MRFHCYILFSLLLSGLLTEECAAEDTDHYYVTPTDSSNPDCPATGEPCYTLDHYAHQFASNSSYSNTNRNFTLLLLRGVHILTQDFRVEHVKKLALRGISDDFDYEHPEVVIKVSRESNIRLFLVEEVAVEKLSIIGNRTQFPLDQPGLHMEVLLQYVSLDSVRLSVNSRQLGSMEIHDCVFLSSSIDVTTSYQNNFDTTVTNTVFYSGPNDSPLKVSAGKSRFTLQVENITIQDLPTHAESQSTEADDDLVCDLYISASSVFQLDDVPAVNITNSRFMRSFGAGICLITAQANNIEMLVTDSTIANHQSGGLVVSLIDAAFKPYVHVTVKNCTIMNNTFNGIGYTLPAAGAGVSVYGGASVNPQLWIIIENSRFFDNRDLRGMPAVIQAIGVANFVIRDCDFQNNKGSAILAYQSTLTLSGNVSFMGNTASNGGALSLTLSTLNVARDSDIVFYNNTASGVGGAVYIEQLNEHLYLDNIFSTTARCFYQLLDLNETGAEYSLSFVNNTAKRGGEHVFGTSLQSFCIAGDKRYKQVRSHEALKYFHFEPNQTSSLSAVSSIPTRVCFCDSNNHFNCSNVTELFRNVSVSPGEEFNISAAIVGVQFGTGTGAVYAQFLPSNDPHAAVTDFRPTYQYTQGTRENKKCNVFNYSVFSGNKREHIALTVSDGTLETLNNIEANALDILYTTAGVIRPEFLNTPVYIEVTLLPCPLGFALEGNPPGCICYPVLRENLASCSISGGGIGYVTRNGSLWVNASFDGGNSTGVFLHKYCPFDYCKTQQVALDLTNPDTQCAYNRSGILCGACEEGYSVALGSSKCLQCTNNNNLALLLFFIAAGIMLVLFIKVLDLTVTRGTINGLIFYANIVWANQSILFSSNASGANSFFKTFIAWLNLDFGIETCFVQGLNGYWKTWLQFVFPFYIWSIAGVIIITTRHSTLLTKLFGNNAVPVLATLFLLSYSKLLRTVITAMGVTYLVDYPNGNQLVVWSFDGNLKYCGFPHIFLFLAALLVLLVLWLPYTSVLLSVQGLQRLSEWKMFRWVDKMKPVFDAYFAPFKDKHHYWVGVLLVARGILLMTFSLTSANVPTANFLAMVVVSVLLLYYTAQSGHLYKKKYISFLETTFLLNLVLLGGGAMYTNLTGGNKDALIFTSVGVTVILFAGIVAIHFWRVVKYCYGHTLKAAHGEEYEDLESVVHQPRDSSCEETVSHDSESMITPVDYSKLREPLLEDSV